MGRQINFDWSRSDVDNFEGFFRSFDSVCSLAQPTPTAEFVQTPSLRREESPGYPGWGMLLARRADLDRVRVKYVATHGHYVVDKTLSPVIEFRALYDLDTGDAPLSPSPGTNRLWFPTSYYDEDENLIAMPPEFLALGERLLRWVRRHFVRAANGTYARSNTHA